MYDVIFSKHAQKDAHRLKQAGLGRQAREIITILEQNPYQSPPRFEKLVGELQDYLSRRINIQHRCIYQVLPNTDKLRDINGNLYGGIVHVLRMWTHYE